MFVRLQTSNALSHEIAMQGQFCQKVPNNSFRRNNIVAGHIACFEGGGPAVLSGTMCRQIPGTNGMLDIADLNGKIKADNQHLCITRLLCLENTTNVGGGRAWPLDQLARVCGWAHENGLKTHLDGARFFNACVAKGYSAADVGKHFDTVSICFSKGLGCPMGSILVGSKDDIRKARRAHRCWLGWYLA